MEEERTRAFIKGSLRRRRFFHLTRKTVLLPLRVAHHKLEIHFHTFHSNLHPPSIMPTRWHVQEGVPVEVRCLAQSQECRFVRVSAIDEIKYRSRGRLQLTVVALQEILRWGAGLWNRIPEFLVVQEAECRRGLYTQSSCDRRLLLSIGTTYQRQGTAKAKAGRTAVKLSQTRNNEVCKGLILVPVPWVVV